jgi:hypothetical protein
VVSGANSFGVDTNPVILLFIEHGVPDKGVLQSIAYKLTAIKTNRIEVVIMPRKFFILYKLPKY